MVNFSLTSNAFQVFKLSTSLPSKEKYHPNTSVLNKLWQHLSFTLSVCRRKAGVYLIDEYKMWVSCVCWSLKLAGLQSFSKWGQQCRTGRYPSRPGHEVALPYRLVWSALLETCCSLSASPLPWRVGGVVAKIYGGCSGKEKKKMTCSGKTCEIHNFWCILY